MSSLEGGERAKDDEGSAQPEEPDERLCADSGSDGLGSFLLQRVKKLEANAAAVLGNAGEAKASFSAEECDGL